MKKKSNEQNKVELSEKKIKISISGIVIFILIATPFLLGKFCELNTPGPFDSGAYVYSAKHILEGAEIGVDEIPSAQTGTLLMNILGVWLFGFNDFGPKIIQGLLQAGALFGMYFAIKSIFNRTAAFLSTLIASFYLSAPVIAKFGNVKEQFMIAFMVLGISFYVLYAKKNKAIFGILAGAMLAWGPLFKQTAISAIFAIIFFLIACPIMRWRSLKQVVKDAMLILVGAAISLGPVYAWIFIGNIKMGIPYKSIVNAIGDVISNVIPDSADTANTASKSGESKSIMPGGYVGRSREAFDLSKQAPIVFRYYWVLITPILLAALSLLVAKIRIWLNWFSKKFAVAIREQEKFVFLFAAWWFLDMLFVWISPRSYEQYYLPLCASGAMTGSYIIWLLKEKTTASLPANKMLWRGLDLVMIFLCISFSWNIFFGLSKSPFSGTDYKDAKGQLAKRKGYVQQIEDANNHRKGNVNVWENVGQYIKENSNESDTIYVWGWYPGMYVKAGRLSSIPRAFESEMHTMSPGSLEGKINNIVESFEKEPPLFIVDSRKRHFPWNRPPLEIWPSTPKGFLPTNAGIVAGYEDGYRKALETQIEPEETKRFDAMKPLRDFVMANYEIVDANGYRFGKGSIYNYRFGTHVVFKLKTK